MKSKIYILLLSVFCGYPILAQESWEKQPQQGSLESVEMEVVGKKNIQLSNANRIYEPIPPRPVERSTEELEYSFNNHFFSGGLGEYRLRPRPIEQQPEEKLYSGYFRGGFGTYSSPLIDAYIANKRSKEFSLGAGFNYTGFLSGPVDGKNSGITLLNTELQGNLYGDKASLLTDARFTRNTLHYYGYPEDTDAEADSIAQIYNRIHFGMELKKNNADEDLNYSLNATVDNLTDDFDAKELDISGDFDIALAVLDDVTATLNGDVSVINRQGKNIDNSRLLFSVNPGAEIVRDKLTAGAGVIAAYTDDTLAGLNGVHLFPDFYAKYEIKKGMNVMGKFYGGINKVTLNSATEENLFVDPNQYLSHEKVAIGVSAKWSGRVKTSFGYDLGIKFEQLNNSHFYLNNPTNQAVFDILYDTGKVNRVNSFISLYFNNSDYYRSVLRIDTYRYKSDVLAEAWHRPTLSIKFTNKFNIGDKMFISFDTQVHNGLKALDTGGELVEIAPIINMNTNLEYVISPKAAAFIMINNLLGNNFSYYYNYPGIGLQLLGGISFKF